MRLVPVTVAARGAVIASWPIRIKSRGSAPVIRLCCSVAVVGVLGLAGCGGATKTVTVETVTATSTTTSGPGAAGVFDHTKAEQDVRNTNAENGGLPFQRVNCVLSSGNEDGPSATFVCNVITQNGSQGQSQLTCEAQPQNPVPGWDCVNAPVAGGSNVQP